MPLRSNIQDLRNTEGIVCASYFQPGGKITEIPGPAYHRAGCEHTAVLEQASQLVRYCAEISTCDRLRFNVPIEQFLSVREVKIEVSEEARVHAISVQHEGKGDHVMGVIYLVGSPIVKSLRRRLMRSLRREVLDAE